MHRNEIHENHEAHKLASELRHHDFADAKRELSKEANHPHEFKRLIGKLNHDLKAQHLHTLTVQHDHHGNVTHLHFGGHDIYDQSHHASHGKNLHSAREQHHLVELRHKEEEARRHAEHKKRELLHHPAKRVEPPAPADKPGDKPAEPQKPGDPPAAPRKPGDQPPPEDREKPETPEEAKKNNDELLKKLDPKLIQLTTKLLEDYANHPSKELNMLRATLEKRLTDPKVGLDEKLKFLNTVIAQTENPTS